MSVYNGWTIDNEAEMGRDRNKISESALVDLLYARAEIAQSQIFTGPIMRALDHIENAIALLQLSGDWDKPQNTEQTEAA
jgi:hypothetical protein